MAPALESFFGELHRSQADLAPRPALQPARIWDSFRAADRDPAPQDLSGFGQPAYALYPYGKNTPNNRRFLDQNAPAFGLAVSDPPVYIYSPKTALGQGLWSQNEPVRGRLGPRDPNAPPWTAILDENGTPALLLRDRRLVVGEVIGGIGGDADSIVSSPDRPRGAPFAPPVPRAKQGGVALRGQAAFDYLEQDPSPIADILAGIYKPDTWTTGQTGQGFSKVQAGAAPAGGGGDGGGRSDVGGKIRITPGG